MTHWKTESDDTKVPNLTSLAGSSVRRKASSTFTSSQVSRMGSNSTGCEDVSSSISDCTPTSGSSMMPLTGKTNGIFTAEKENEYNFDLSEASNEAESVILPLRNGLRVPPNSTFVLSHRANSTVTTSTDTERPSNSGIPFSLNVSNFSKDRNSGKTSRGALGSSNELPSSSSSTESYKQKGGMPGGASSALHSGTPAYRNKYKPSVPVAPTFPNQISNSWSSLMNTSTSPESERTPGNVGLHNMGNTCYMNSGLQCLIHTPSLVEYFLKLKVDRRKANSIPILAEFQLIMQHAWFGLTKSLYITNFRNIVHAAHSTFDNIIHQDSQEFLALMLGSLDEQLKFLMLKNADVTNSVEVNGDGNGENPYKADSNSAVESDTKSSTLHKRNGEIESPKMSSKRARFDGGGDCCKEFEAVGSDAERIRTEPLTNRLEEEIDKTTAVEYWANFVKENNTVITTTFLGVLNNTMTCQECSYSSNKFDPFMYLGVPIPSTQDIGVTFVSLKERRPIKVTVPINVLKHTVNNLKELVAKEISEFSADYATLQDCVVVEVMNNSVVRKLNNDMRLNFLQYGTRNIYMYELNDNFCEKYGRFTNTFTLSEVPPCISLNTGKTYTSVPPDYEDTEDWDQSPTPAPELTIIHNGSTGVADTTTTTSPVVSPSGFIGPLLPETKVDTNSAVGRTTEDEPMETDENCERRETGSGFEGDQFTCVICLGDFGHNDAVTGIVLRHTPCGTILCDACIQRAISYFHKEILLETEGTSTVKYLNCPTCSQKVVAEAFVKFGSTESRSELNLVAVLLRLPLDYNNNSTRSSGRLFGAPFVVRIPTSVEAEELYSFIADINPFPELEVSLVKVSADGTRCSACYEDGCDGCIVEREGILSIPLGSALALSYIQISQDQIASVEPTDMATSAQPVTSSPFPVQTDLTVDLHDCLRTFFEVEHLDPVWKCDQCKQAQRSTKSMAISRFPSFLIINLKRFATEGAHSTKIETKLRFPLHDLDLTPYMDAGADASSNSLYDLYSCVCHVGSLGSGHYTAFAKNPVTNCWNLFNDERIIPCAPTEKEYASVYLMFYQRRDSNLKYDIPKRTEETILRNPPISLITLPSSSATSGPIALYNAPITNGHCATALLQHESSPLVLHKPGYATSLETTVMEEMNFSAGHVTHHNLPLVSSSKAIESSSRGESGSYSYLVDVDDDGFEDDNLLDPLTTTDEPLFQQGEPSSQSGYDEDDGVSTSSTRDPQWSLD